MDENPYRGPSRDEFSGLPTRQKSPIFTLAKLLTVLGIIGLVISLTLPAVRSAREPARRNNCMGKLRQIALALQNYVDTHHALPPAYTTDVDGKPLHSWRTLILPYLEERALYDSIDLTKPWDDPANAKAFNTSVDAYQCPSAPESDNHTIYLAVLTPNSCFRATEPRNLTEITDDASQTLMVIEVDLDHAVPWMAPVDADEGVVMSIGSKSNLAHAGGVNAAFVNGSSRFLEADMPASQRRALISIAGNDKAAAEGAE